MCLRCTEIIGKRSKRNKHLIYFVTHISCNLRTDHNVITVRQYPFLILDLTILNCKNFKIVAKPTVTTY